METIYVVGIGVVVFGFLRNSHTTAAVTDGPSATGVGDIARAIAHAEGFGVDAVNLPTRQHNPGDIKSGGSIATYPDDAAGWAALENQVTKILDGSSRYYRPDMPLIQIANIWTGADHAISWAETVAGDLGITINDPLTSYQGL